MPVILVLCTGSLNNTSSCYRLGLECNRHRICRHCMLQAYSGMHDPFVYIGIISCKKNNSARFKISRMITSNNGKAKFFYHEIMVVWHNTVLQCGKKWAWPSKHFLACAACGLLPPRSKNPSYAPAIDWAWIAYLGPTRYT